LEILPAPTPAEIDDAEAEEDESIGSGVE